MGNTFSDRPPAGVGIYTLRLPKGGTRAARKLAKKFVDHGLTWIAIGGPWHDVHNKKSRSLWMAKPQELRRWADAFHMAGVAVHVWGFPWHDRVNEFLLDMQAVTFQSVSGWLLDPELGFKRKASAAKNLAYRADRITTSQGIALGVTSYGRARFHKTFPFAEFNVCDYGSPQLYTAKAAGVRAGIREWLEHEYETIVPSVGLYRRGKNRKAVALKPHELHDHLSTFVDVATPVRSVIAWQLAFLRANHWPVLERWSAWLKAGVCTTDVEGLDR